MITPNLFDNLPAQIPVELVDTLLSSQHFRVERIFSRGHASPPDFWYDQDHAEWVLLISGEARLRVGAEIVELRAGSHINIPAHQRHRVEWTDPTQPTVWLAIHYS